jgi:hypothetical protein
MSHFVLYPFTDTRQSRDKGNSDFKYATITAYDNDRKPIGVTDFRSRVDKSQDNWRETWFFRESTGQLDVTLDYYQGVFAKTIGGSVAFPWANHYTDGGSKCIKSGPQSSRGSSTC